MKFESEVAVCFDDVLLVPQYSGIASRSDVRTDDIFPRLRLPVIASNMDSITEIGMMVEANKSGAMGILHRYMTPKDTLDQMKRAEVAVDGPKCAAVGAMKSCEEKQRIDLLLENISDLWLCVDIAHGHAPFVAETVRYIKECRPEVFVIAGNVATAQGGDFLAEAGADALRVGVGGGSICSTRIKTGCGLPTLASVLDCAENMKTKTLIIADGGLKTAAHASIAIAAGASAVMLGGMLAGTDAVPKWTKEGIGIEYRGMASAAAKKDFGRPEVMAEGVARTVTCKAVGSTKKMFEFIREGIVSAASYQGASNMAEFQEKAVMRRVSTLTVQESYPHFEDTDVLN